QHACQRGILAGDGVARELHHLGIDAPFGIQRGIPMRLVVGLVPELDGFDHDERVRVLDLMARDLPPPRRATGAEAVGVAAMNSSTARRASSSVSWIGGDFMK